MTDKGNARRLILKHGKHLRYLKARDLWLVWNGKHWAPDETGEVVRLAKQVIADLAEEARSASDGEESAPVRKWQRRCETPARISAMLDWAKTEPGINVLPDQLNADPWKFNCRNGTVDLRTGQLHPHNSEDLHSKLADNDYDPKAQCSVFLKFLQRISNEDATWVNYVQRIFGYALTGDTREQCFFFSTGGGENGKSTLISTLLHIAGPYGKTSAPEVFLKRNYATHPTEVADIQGCRVIVTPEVEQGRALNEALLKQLSGGDKIKARYLFHDFFEFTPTAKVILSANTLPEIRGADHGIWRRVRVIPFDVTISAEEKDPQLLDKLKAEAPGILAWAVQGCLAWQQRRLSPPDRILRATAEYRETMDIVGRFLTDACERHPKGRESAADLFQAFECWCAANGEAVLTQKDFGSRLLNHGLRGLKSNGRTVRVGVRLKGRAPGEGRDDGEGLPIRSSDCHPECC